MKKQLGFVIAAAVMVSLVACGGNAGEENSAIESKGVFLLAPDEAFDLSKEKGLSENEAYLIHVYDIIPDAKKNADMSAEQEDYTVTCNGINEYDAVTASSGAAMLSFTYGSGYAIDQKIGTVFAGNQPIRVISVFKVNKNDVTEDAELTFQIAGSALYCATVPCRGEEVVTVSMLDKIFHIEEDPSQYQMASTILWRSQGIKNAVNYLGNHGGLSNGTAVFQTLTALEINTMMYLSAGLDSNSDLVYYHFDADNLSLVSSTENYGPEPEELLNAVEAVYPEIADQTRALFAAKDVYAENLRLCSDPGTQTDEALQQLNLAGEEILSSVNEIYTFFTA